MPPRRTTPPPWPRWKPPRRRVIEPLAALRQSLKNAAGPDFAAAVYRYAEAAGALQNLTQNSPLPQREAVDRQWNSLVDVLDLMTDFYPERALNAREWSELFRPGPFPHRSGRGAKYRGSCHPGGKRPGAAAKPPGRLCPWRQ